MAFEQAGSSLNLFAKEKTDNRVLGYSYPASWYQSVNSLFIISLAPLFSWLWVRMGRRQPSSPAKFSAGLFAVGFGFVVLVAASSLVGDGKVSPAWLIGVYLFHTIGELLLSPVGLSTVTKLAPERIAGLMMGVWFLSLSLGNLMGGWVAGFFDASAEGALVRLFGAVAITTISAGAVIALLSPWVRRLMGTVH
jgi:POT family proton-dependent oligopeptide transporter